MHTKILMNLSAVWMALLGLIASFLPQEVLAHFGAAPDKHAALFLQILGAAYLGFAMMNWMAREVLIGGIYSRPLAMGNMVHFLVAGLALVKAASGERGVIGIALVYGVFAVWFGMVVFRHPLKEK
jgi:hypothetical protein